MNIATYFGLLCSTRTEASFTLFVQLRIFVTQTGYNCIKREVTFQNTAIWGVFQTAKST